MTNKSTSNFLAVIDTKSKVVLLNNIAKNYGISSDEALAEIIASTWDLLDYLSEPVRTATKVLMAQHGTVIAYKFVGEGATAELRASHEVA